MVVTYRFPAAMWAATEKPEQTEPTPVSNKPGEKKRTGQFQCLDCKRTFPSLKGLNGHKAHCTAATRGSSSDDGLDADMDAGDDSSHHEPNGSDTGGLLASAAPARDRGGNVVKFTGGMKPTDTTVTRQAKRQSRSLRGRSASVPHPVASPAVVPPPVVRPPVVRPDVVPPPVVPPGLVPPVVVPPAVVPPAVVPPRSSAPVAHGPFGSAAAAFTGHAVGVSGPAAFGVGTGGAVGVAGSGPAAFGVGAGGAVGGAGGGVLFGNPPRAPLLVGHGIGAAYAGETPDYSVILITGTAGVPPAPPVRPVQFHAPQMPAVFGAGTFGGVWVCGFYVLRG